MGPGTSVLQNYERGILSLAHHCCSQESLMNPENQMTEKPLGAVKISGRVLHEVDHDPPSKCPDQDWWHLIETQVAQGAQSTCRATKELACGGVTLASHPFIRTGNRAKRDHHAKSNQENRRAGSQHLHEGILIRRQSIRARSMRTVPCFPLPMQTIGLSGCGPR